MTIGHYGTKCNEPGWRYVAAAFWLHWGYFGNIFGISGYLRDKFGLNLGYFVVIMTQSALNPVWRYVAAAFWLHSLTLSHNRSTVVQLRQRDVTRLQVIVIS